MPSDRFGNSVDAFNSTFTRPNETPDESIYRSRTLDYSERRARSRQPESNSPGRPQRSHTFKDHPKNSSRSPARVPEEAVEDDETAPQEPIIAGNEHLI